MNDSYHPSRSRYERDSGLPKDGGDRYSPPRRDYADSHRNERRNEDAYLANGRGSNYRDNDNNNSNTFRFRGAASEREGARDARADTYRPPRSNFTFRASGSGPAAPHFPPAPKSQQQQQLPRRNRAAPRGDRGGRGGRGRGRGGRYIKPAHNRAILAFTEDGVAEEMFGTAEHAKFDAAMESSDADEDEDDEDDEQPQKRVKVNDEAEAPPARPQWTNPDPYSVLPPTDVVTTAKKDIVQTIRKRKSEAVAAAATVNSIAQNDDFISFNFDDDEIKEESEEGEIASSEGNDDDFVGAPSALSAARLPPPPPPEDNSYNSYNAYIPPPPPDLPLPPPPSGFVMPSDDELMKTYAGGAAGKRKRGFEQTVSSSAGTIVDEWLPDGSNMTPWVPQNAGYTSSVGLRYVYTLTYPAVACWLPDHSSSVVIPKVRFSSLADTSSSRLHKEIMDFYEYVGPRDYERDCRTDLIDRIDRVVRNFNGRPDVSVQSFGSFASDLYLPTADMDLVAVSRSYMAGGQPTFCDTKSKMYKLANMIKSRGICDQVIVIGKAKVPILKFVDDATGIKVDISFENDSGLCAIPTFKEWKQRYPQMPILVMVIKQFLTMRGLNEVFSGGIGGYTIICLVTSMLQHMPEPPDCDEYSLGELLQEFFDLYGNRFDVRVTGIIMNPPRLFQKGRDRVQCKINANTLTIVDPNRPDNDISGGSREILRVFKCFSGAHAAIQKRLNEVRTGKSNTQSILGCIIGGCYTSFEAQRTLLHDLDGHDRPKRSDASQNFDQTSPLPPPRRETLPQHQTGYYNYPQYPELPQAFDSHAATSRSGPPGTSLPHTLPNQPPPGLRFGDAPRSPPQAGYAFFPYGLTAAGDWSSGPQYYESAPPRDVDRSFHRR